MGLQKKQSRTSSNIKVHHPRGTVKNWYLGFSLRTSKQSELFWRDEDGCFYWYFPVTVIPKKKTIKRRIKRRGKAVCSCFSRTQSFCGQQIIHISVPFHWCREKQQFGPYVTIECEQKAILSKEVLPTVSLVLSRDYKGHREDIPHIHPIPQVIRLELFLESG